MRYVWWAGFGGGGGVPVRWLQCGIDDWLVGRTYTCANMIAGRSLCWCDKCFGSKRVIQHRTDDWRCSVSWTDVAVLTGGAVWNIWTEDWRREYEIKRPNIDFNDHSVLSTNHVGDQIKVDEMGCACGKWGWEQQYMLGVGGATWGWETTWKRRAYTDSNKNGS